MVKNDIRPYEISLWTLQDSFITVLKPFGLSNRGQIETPKCRIKNDGTQELNFTIPMYYREGGILIENPIWYNVINGSLIVNLRKLKLIFNKGAEGEEVVEFVINKVVETHSNGQLKCEVTAEGLAFQELGKVGYKISLSSQDFLDEYQEWYETEVGEGKDFSTQDLKNAAEPKNNINYWCEKIFKKSRWDYEIQMDWSAFDGIIVNDISGSYNVPDEKGNEKEIIYKGTYQEAPKEIQEAFNKIREKTLRRLDRIYEEEYISSWTDQKEQGKLVPEKIENFKEKLRLVDLEKSNMYNLTQDLAQTFGVFCKYKYLYDANYHIIGKKCVFYNNFLSEKDGKIDIIYPYSTSKIEREIDSADIVTKMFVTPMEDTTSSSGLVTIADISANKMREDYILNFDYLYSIGTITQEQYDYIADYERSMYLTNIELEPIAMQIANLQKDLVKYEAQKTFAHEAQIQDQEQMEQAQTTKNSIMNNNTFLTRNKENPIRGTLLLDEKTKSYYINITQEGIDYAGKNAYLLTQYKVETDKKDEQGKPIMETKEVWARGIRLFYYRKVDETIDKILVPYEEDSTANPDKPDNTDPESIPIYPSNIGMELTNGNLTRLTGLQLKVDSISNSIFIACTYSPETHYQNIYDFYLGELAKHEAQEAEATAQIDKINKDLEALTARYEELLEEKTFLIADFENMMGPALREGSWQADSYTDYGSKYSHEVKVNLINKESHINFFWDETPFEEEQLLYYPDNGGLNRQTYYYAINLSNHLNNIKEYLDKLSFIYDRVIVSEGKEIVQNTYRMTIGSEAAYAFIKGNNGFGYPILLLLDKTFTKEKKEGDTSYFTNFRIGLITTSVEVEQKEDKLEETTVVKEEIKVLIPKENITWVENLRNEKQVFPRLKSDSLLLKTSEDELIIQYIKSDLQSFHTLRNYYDYSVLIREENYFITLKSPVMLKDGIIEKTFKIAYTLSNAATALYLDALEVSKTNATPQVSYTLEVSAMNETFIKFAYKNLNRIVSINDTDLKFEDVQGYISELDLVLDSPWEDSITVQNYKTKFEDLFSTIVASTEQMKVNSFAYNNAASSFGPGGTLKPSVIQNTLNQVDLTYAFQSGNLTIDEINGIWARSDTGVVAMRGGGIFCATEQDSNGNWLWNTGIMPSGINASLITAGQIDTNLIKIYAGDNLRLQLNQDGLFAYNKNAIGEADLNQYVVHNNEGLFLVQPDNNNKLSNKVEISWNGLILRNNQNDKVFYADNDGNLTITGQIKAASGNIGNWEVTSKGLWYKNGTAGLIPDSGEKINDDLHILYGHEKIFWVESTVGEEKKEFVVTTDGTLYCNDIIAKGTIAAGSVIGNTTVGEIDEQLRTISVSNLDGTTFSFDNRNYDRNLIISPRELKFIIYTNALTKEELITPEQAEKDKTTDKDAREGYKFYYSLDEKTWIPMPALIENENEFMLWKPNYLTFILKSDIMYIGLNKTIDEPHSTLYLKVEKEGRQRIVNSIEDINYSGVIVEKEEENDKGEIVITKVEEPYIYSSTFQLVSEKNGLGKHVSPLDPPSYTFVEDKNLEIQYKDEISFSTILTGFDLEKDLEELENSTWLINGEDYNLRAKLVSSLALEPKGKANDTAILISDKEDIFIEGEKVEEPYVNEEGEIIYTEIDGNVSDSKNGISISLMKQEDGSIRAAAVVSKESVPDGGNIKLTFKIGQATRDCFCFKTRNGSDGVNIVLRSSSGSTLSNRDTKTELSTEIYYGSHLMNGEDSETQFYYVWKKDNEALSSISKLVVSEVVNPDTTEITMVDKLEKFEVKNEGTNIANINFFIQPKIYITAEDFGLKSDYRCDVFTSLKEAVDEYLLLNKNKDEELIIPELEEKE